MMIIIIIIILYRHGRRRRRRSRLRFIITVVFFIIIIFFFIHIRIILYAARSSSLEIQLGYKRKNRVRHRGRLPSRGVDIIFFIYFFFFPLHNAPRRVPRIHIIILHARIITYAIHFPTNNAIQR